MRPALHVLAGDGEPPAQSETGPDAATTPQPWPLTEEDRRPAVVRAAEAYYRGEIDPQELLEVFRATPVWVHRTISPPAVMITSIPGLGSWVQGFTSRDRLAVAVGTGDYMTMLGGEIVDLLLPALPSAAGMLLDPGSPHMLAWPALPRTSGPDTAAPRTA